MTMHESITSCSALIDNLSQVTCNSVISIEISIESIFYMTLQDS